MGYFDWIIKMGHTPLGQWTIIDHLLFTSPIIIAVIGASIIIHLMKRLK